MNDQAAAPHADPERAFDGQYQLGSEIGAGALGVVYRGVDEKLDKQVAIKVWHARFDDATPQREQYDTEARALTALEHPNLVAITDYGIAGKAPYLVMELLEGERLDTRMRAGVLRSAQAQSFMQSVLRGLGYMHMRGVVHRNLKPDNVFLAKAEGGETLKLLDVGLESLSANDNAANGGTKQPASVYDPPERDQGNDPDGRADVYAAGVLMLHMLLGLEPAGELLLEAGQPGGAEALSIVLPSAQGEVKTFIAKAVATERSARFGNADQMLRALLELPTPWLIGEVEEAAPVAAASVAAPAPSKSQAAHAEFGSSETMAMPAADGGEALTAADAAALEEFEHRPIGLIAKLRARKMLVLIVGGIAGLGVVGVVLASFLGGAAQTEKVAEQAAAKKQSAAKSKQHAVAAGAPALEHPYHPEEAEEVSETEQAKGAAGQLAAPPLAAVHGSEPAAAAAQHEAKPEQPGAAAESGAVGDRTQGTAARLAADAERSPAAVLHAEAAAPSGEAPGKAEPRAAADHAEAAKAAVHGDAAHADEDAKATPEHEPAAASGATNAKATGEEAKAGERVEPGAASTALPPPAAEEKHAQQPAPPKKPPTPQGLGSERHIALDQAEIRQMLALAIKSSARVAAADPWDIAVPSSLQALRDAIARGERGTPGNIKTLRRYNAASPEDVYGHLLLAGFYTNRGYALDALDQYDMAYGIDSSSRGAPEMLKHALNMVAQGIAATEAERFINRVFGREAQAQLTQQLRASSTNAAAANRLRQLQARLTSKRR